MVSSLTLLPGLPSLPGGPVGPGGPPDPIKPCNKDSVMYIKCHFEIAIISLSSEFIPNQVQFSEVNKINCIPLYTHVVYNEHIICRQC